MLIETLKTLFKRDLQRLRDEIAAFTNEENIWRTDQDITNSSGTLCLHLIGNLNAFIGVVYGKTGYVRQRNLEFSLRDVPRIELIEQIDATLKMVDASLDQISDDQLQGEYPLFVFNSKKSTLFFLLHLSTHLNYHLGQVNYHRRLLDR